MVLTPPALSEAFDPAVGHPRRRAILGVLCLSLLVVVIDNTILNTALPTLARDLPAGISSLQWIVDAYTLCFAALLIPAGAIGDRSGRRRALLGGLAVFAAGSLAASMASSAGVLIAERVVMGAAAAFVMPATLSILNSVFPPAERPKAIGAWSAVAGIAVVIGPTLGGLLLDYFSWGSVFLVNVPLVAVAMFFVWRIVPETAEPGAGRFDAFGAVLVAVGFFCVVDAIIEAPDRGWLSPATLGLVAAGVVVLVWFVRRSLRIANPMIDLRVFANAAFSASVGAVTVLSFALFGSLFALTQYLQLVHGYSPLSAGLRALPFAAAMGAMSPASAVLSRRFGTRLAALSMLQPATPYVTVAGFVALMGAGMGLVMAPASTTIMGAVPTAQAGTASAVNDTIREVGGTLGVAVLGSLTAAVYRSRLTPTLAAHHAPAPVVRLTTSSVAAADAVGRHIGGTVGHDLVGAAHEAFVNGMALGLRVAAVTAIVGALGAWVALPPRRAGGLAVLDIEPVETAVPVLPAPVDGGADRVPALACGAPAA
jgi:EmrB/QacA subfamily drug resistance transporter